MQLADYLAHPAASASDLLNLQRSPAYARLRKSDVRPPTPAQLLGSAVHCAVLEPDEFPARYVCADVCAGRFKNGKRCTAAGKYLNDGAWFCGRHGKPAEATQTVLSPEHWEATARIAHAVTSSPLWQSLGLTEFERSAFGSIEGVETKARPDALGPGVVVDLKTTHLIGNIRGLAYWMNWPVRVAHYRDTIGGDPRMVYVVVAADAPHEVFVHEWTVAQIEEGRSQHRRLLATWRECSESGAWPGGNAEIEPMPLDGGAVDWSEVEVEEDTDA